MTRMADLREQSEDFFLRRSGFADRITQQADLKRENDVLLFQCTRNFMPLCHEAGLQSAGGTGRIVGT